MSGIIDIGRSALLAQREAMNVTGQNIANVSTDGYKRREARLAEVNAGQAGALQVPEQSGLGVRLGEIRRAYNSFLADSARTATSRFEAASTLEGQLERIENLLLPREGDLASAINRFSDSLQAVATNPGDRAPRVVAIEEGRGLAAAFRLTAELLNDLSDKNFAELDLTLDTANTITDGLARVNGRLRSAGMGAAAPNALLDERDRLLDALSALVSIGAEIGPGGTATVRLGSEGNGPILVQGDSAVALVAEGMDPTNLTLRTSTGQSVGPLDGGQVQGLRDSHSAIQRIRKELDQLSLDISTDLNDRHRQGLDLSGAPGTALFSTAAFDVAAAPANKGNARVTVTPIPGEADRLSTIALHFDGERDAWVALDDRAQIVGIGRESIALVGAIIQVAGSGEPGDRFSVTRVGGDAGRMQFLLEDAGSLAAASAIRALPSIENSGTAILRAVAAPSEPSDIRPINEVLADNLSPVEATQFRQGGVVASIPAAAKSVTLASLASQASALIGIEPPEALSRIDVTLGGTTYQFAVAPDLAGQTVWPNSAAIADALNAGVLSAIGPGGTPVTLVGLGLRASGFSEGLSFSSATTGFESVSALVAGRLVTTTASAPAVASDLMVFTREGRQIAGPTLAPAEAAELLTVENGFANGAVYHAGYTDGAYRALTLERHSIDGDAVLDLSLDVFSGGKLSGPIAQDPPRNHFVQQTVSVLTSDGRETTIDLPAGIAADYVANQLSDSLMPLGLSAEAATRVRLSLADAEATGALSFSVAVGAGEPVQIEAAISGGRLADVAKALESAIGRSGIEVSLGSDARHLVISHPEGKDIKVSDPLGVALTAMPLGGNYMPLLDSPVLLDQTTHISGQVTLSSRSNFSITSSIGGTLGTSSRLETSGGLIIRRNSEDGTRVALGFAFNDALERGAANSDGTRVHAPMSAYTLSLAADGGDEQRIQARITSGTSAVTPAEIGAQIAAALRGQAPVPRLLGAPIATLPPVGASVNLYLGSETYMLTNGLDGLKVTGPEQDRILADMRPTGNSETPYQLELTVPGGQLGGRGLRAVDDAEAAVFGLDTSSARSAISGRGFNPDTLTLPTNMSVRIGDVDVTISLAADENGDPSVSSSSPDLLTASLAANGTDRVLTLTATSGAALPTPIGSASAAALGFRVAQAEIRVTEDGLALHGSDGHPVDVRTHAESIAGDRLTLSNLPDEELLVVLGNTGARRLVAEYEIAAEPPDPLDAVSRFRVEMVDASTGRLELFDAVTGQSLATRTLQGETSFAVGGIRMELTGTAHDGDSFEIVTRQASVGDGGNMDALVALTRGRDSGEGYGDRFRTIALGAGAMLESTRMTRVSTEAVRDAAVAAEDSLSGVKLDEEAASLIEQQQAYQAAARILQTAIELFDTLIQLR